MPRTKVIDYKCTSMNEDAKLLDTARSHRSAGGWLAPWLSAATQQLHQLAPTLPWFQEGDTDKKNSVPTTRPLFHISHVEAESKKSKNYNTAVCVRVGKDSLFPQGSRTSCWQLS